MRRWMAYVLFLAPILLTVGCPGDSSDPVFFQTAELSVVHASPGADIDLWVEDSAVLANIPFGTASDYQEIQSGDDRLIQLFESGTTRLVAVINPDLDAFTQYTLFLVGDFSDPEVVFVEDDLEQADDNEFEVRALNAAKGLSESLGNLDLYITQPNTDVNDVAPTVANVAYKDITGFGSLVEGNYRIQVTPTGSKEVLYDSGTIGFLEDRNITLVIQPASEGNRPLMMTAVDAASSVPSFLFRDVRSRMRLIHGISDNENLELLVNGQLLASGLAFKDASDHLDIQSGEAVDVTVRQASSSMPLIEETLPIENLTDRTLIAANSLADPVAILLDDDPAPDGDGTAQLRFAHAASLLLNPIDVYITEPGADITNLEPDITAAEFQDVSPHLTLDPGNFEVQITETGQKSVVLNEPFTLAEGDAMTAVGFDPPPGMSVPFSVGFFSDRPTDGE